MRPRVEDIARKISQKPLRDPLILNVLPLHTLLHATEAP